MTTGAKRNSSSMNTKITRQLVICVAICLCALAVVTAVAAALIVNDGVTAQLRANIVELNGLSQSASTANESQAITQAQDALRQAANANDLTALIALILVATAALVCLAALSAYLYVSVVRPFSKLQNFAEEVASGNLDLPLEYERSNPFGKFAWAFDHMRSELKRARKNELAAIEANKTVMASLAHDLRTPIASIRTYSEALDMGLDRTEEERQEYIHVIERKCGEVSQLVDDMLTHSLAELDRISVECSVVSASLILQQAVDDFGLIEATVANADDALICADELRLRQVVENLLVNASKYAPSSKVEVSGSAANEEFYRISIRDFGPGMAPEDIPFAFERFYRGSNAKDIQGSGLGLFVVKYVIERMGGRAMLQNAHPGLAVFLDVPLEGPRFPKDQL